MNKKPRLKTTAARLRRKKHIRKTVNGTPVRPRLSVFRSNVHIYAQLVDDISGKTIISFNSNTKEFKALADGNEKIKTKTDVAFLVGQEVAKKALAANIESVVFDRNGFLYHGRVKALADGARKEGLKL
ncbi:MAG: 50S ribosomal protein L18 [Candidatus Cloacimonadota bacterium]|nr:ribosomal protein L18 [uncultured bacterium]PID31144.1 MAG: 50S ribosomal protein L18 [Candidatus Cloacimonadota bacterium]PIE79136.1 MAG: 50S ribosomal protein L18 [Candidatus Delongbacteria bacterium]